MDELEKLIQALRDDETDAYAKLRDALQHVNNNVLAGLVSHAHAGVRCAALEAARGRADGTIREAARARVDDESADVRRLVAEVLAPDAPERGALLDDTDFEVRRAAVRSAGAAYRNMLHELLVDDASWEVREAAARALAELGIAASLPPLFVALAHDDDMDVARACAVSLERQLGAKPDRAGVAPDIQLAKPALERLKQLRVRRYPQLNRLLEGIVANEPDVGVLREVGTDLTAAAEAGELPRAHDVDSIVDALRNVLEGPGARAAVLIGEAGVGKTAAIHELVHRLDGWRVIRVSPAEILAGTVYLGEWQTKVQKLIDAARAPRKVLLYIPNLQQLSDVGRTSKTDTNVATMLAPHIESGALAIVGETTTEDFRAGLGKQASLRRLFTAIEVVPASDRAARDLIEVVAAEADADVDEQFCDRLMDLAAFYMPGAAQPGRTLGLLRRVLDRREGDEPLTARAVLQTLQESTGIPTDFLDDAVPLDLEETRAFFEARVMGQPEAIDAVLDLVTLVKAGLNDPGKPYGVLFFVGPTGVGKTELARALAELLFGDAGRLRRFDMSEYANYASYERLIGSEGSSGTLAETVRDHPFSVILFDEIEKAHGNVYDLCLQLFDAGRLTDGTGRTADFRNTILIMTSNVGSQVRTEKALGFADAAPPPPDRASIDRELARFFRPEFLNRLDRIVHFQPLGEETAERIARRELAQVVERSGIARRQLAVDLDPSIVALLLKHGYSPAFGARPLKRTVERLVLLPVARAIAGGSAPPGSILRLAAFQNEVRVAIVPPDEPDDAAAPEVDTPALADVRARIEALQPGAAEFRARKTALLEQANAPGFWDDRGRALGTLDEINRLEKVLEDLGGLEEQVGITARNRDAGKAGRYARKHAREAIRLQRLFEEGDLADALVTLTLVKRKGKGIDGVEMLARMYLGFAGRRGLETTVIDDRREGDPAEDTISLLVDGAGAYACLRQEAGLHTVKRPGGPAVAEARSLVRVDVLRAPADAAPFDLGAVRIEERPLRAARGRLLASPDKEVRMLHVPSMTSLRAWTNDDGRDALHALLRARIEERGAGAPTGTVRRYRLGAAPLVSDSRTGATTGNLDRVLAGELDLFA